MKYIIFMILIGSFVACDQGSSEESGDDVAIGGAGTTGVRSVMTIFNNSDMLIRIKKGGDDGDDSNSQVLALREGECVALSEGELAVLTVEEDDIGFGLDDILCSNMDASQTPCEAGDKVVQEAEDGDGYVLAKARKPNENCLSIHGVQAAREAATE